jgi:hypothetical protein
VTNRRDFVAAGVLPFVGPTRGPQSPPPGHAPALEEWEAHCLATIRRLGRDQACDRLYLAGAYGLIADVITRLGTDAVGELKRLAREAEARGGPG